METLDEASRKRVCAGRSMQGSLGPLPEPAFWGRDQRRWDSETERHAA